MIKNWMLAAFAIAILCAIGLRAEIDGKVNGGVLRDEAAKVQAANIKEVYESHEFTVTGSTTNYNTKINQSAFLTAKVPRAHNIIIRTDVDIVVRFNSASNDPVTIRASDNQLSWSHLEVTNIFITTTGTAAVKIFLS